MHQVVLKTHDLQKTITLYTTVLPFQHIYTIPGDESPYTLQTLLRCDDMHLLFLEDKTNSHRPHLRAGELHRIAFRVPTGEALTTFRTTLLEKHIEVSSIVRNMFNQSIYLFDPNGILLEISTPYKKS